MKLTIKTIGVFLLMVMVSSCKKGCLDPIAQNYNADAKREDGSCSYNNEPPQFSMHGPIEWASFNQGDTVLINGEVNWSKPMHGYEIYMMHSSKQDTVFGVHQHYHSNNMNLLAAWINNISENQLLEIEIKVYIDHQGDFITKTIWVECLPN